MSEQAAFVLYAAVFLLTLIVAAVALGAMILAWADYTTPLRWRVVRGLAGFAVLSLILGGFFYSIRDTGSSGPCLQTATGMAYNPGTKTMMPYTYCTQRGEWVQ